MSAGGAAGGDGGDGPAAFQGERGAWSEIAAARAFPGRARLACASFEEVFAAVAEGRAGRAVIPVENARAGRVAGIHDLLPESGLHVVGEAFQEVRHALLAPPGATLETLRRVRSHEQALSQCRGFLRARGLEPLRHADTAGAAREVAAAGDPAEAALASPLAGRAHGLRALMESVQDEETNVTRFLLLAREPGPTPPPGGGEGWITSLVFRVRSVPAALYKALGGFATCGLNITKLESYIVDAGFTLAQFHIDVEGRPGGEAMRIALEELGFFSAEVRILGVYPPAPFRRDGAPDPPDAPGAG